jgi:hypothetical protein
MTLIDPTYSTRAPPFPRVMLTPLVPMSAVAMRAPFVIGKIS